MEAGDHAAADNRNAEGSGFWHGEHPHFEQRSQTPPPGPLPEAERGRKTGLVPLSFGGGFLLLLPLSASGRRLGGGVLRADRSGRVVLAPEDGDGTPQVLQAAQ